MSGSGELGQRAEIAAEPRPRCDVCGAVGTLRHEGLRDELFGAPGDWRLRACESAECGVIWLDPMPTESGIRHAYRRYYTHERQAAGAAHRAAAAACNALWRLTRVGRERERLQLMWLDDVPPGRLLDVGCGDARGLQALIARGWRVEGQEVDPAAAAEARAHGVAVHEGELAALGLPAERFDAVTLNHVIEHVHDPLGLLVECRRLLRPGGILVAVTPNAGSLGHRRFGPAWRGLEPPRHLHVFSTAALGRLAVAAGFSDVSTRSTGANAYTFGAASSMLAARRAGRPLGFVGARVRALGFQVSESLSMMTAPDAGEECILRAAR